MISPALHPGSSLHPASVRAACVPRGRWAFGLTGRSIGLLIAGFVWLIPGFWDGQLGYAMLAWDAPGAAGRVAGWLAPAACRGADRGPLLDQRARSRQRD